MSVLLLLGCYGAFLKADHYDYDLGSLTSKLVVGLQAFSVIRGRQK